MGTIQVRVSREEVSNVMRLSKVRSEIKQLEKTEKELQAELDEKMNAKTKYLQMLSKNE